MDGSNQNIKFETIDANRFVDVEVKFLNADFQMTPTQLILKEGSGVKREPSQYDNQLNDGTNGTEEIITNDSDDIHGVIIPVMEHLDDLETQTEEVVQTEATKSEKEVAIVTADKKVKKKKKKPKAQWLYGFNDDEVKSEHDIHKRHKGEVLGQKERQIVLNVFKYFLNNGQNVSRAARATSAATGCSERTIFKIKKESENGTLATPGKNRKKRAGMQKNARSRKYDEFVCSSIRNIVHSFYERNIPPVLSSILAVVNSRAELPDFKRTTFYRLLKDIGFAYKKAGNKTTLIERKPSKKKKQADGNKLETVIEEIVSGTDLVIQENDATLDADPTHEDYVTILHCKQEMHDQQMEEQNVQEQQEQLQILHQQQQQQQHHPQNMQSQTNTSTINIIQTSSPNVTVVQQPVILENVTMQHMDGTNVLQLHDTSYSMTKGNFDDQQRLCFFTSNNRY